MQITVSKKPFHNSVNYHSAEASPKQVTERIHIKTEELSNEKWVTICHERADSVKLIQNRSKDNKMNKNKSV
jgi:hypothetical protein